MILHKVLPVAILSMYVENFLGWPFYVMEQGSNILVIYLRYSGTYQNIQTLFENILPTK